MPCDVMIVLSGRPARSRPKGENQSPGCQPAPPIRVPAVHRGREKAVAVGHSCLVLYLSPHSAGSRAILSGLSLSQCAPRADQGRFARLCRRVIPANEKRPPEGGLLIGGQCQSGQRRKIRDDIGPVLFLRQTGEGHLRARAKAFGLVRNVLRWSGVQVSAECDFNASE